MGSLKNAVWLFLLTMAAIAIVALTSRSTRQPIRVGILHSDSGTMAISERSVRDATMLAIEQINARGGVLGRQLKPVILDGESDPATFRSTAEKLIVDHNVAVVFGCWTSATRKTVRPIFEQHDHLLFYPVQYEGLEQSPNIVYTGAAPNQQILPAVKWCVDRLNARKFYLVGSDYVFPQTANTIIETQVNALGGKIVGEQYLLLGSNDVKAIVADIESTRPDVILNTINGDSNVAFFRELRRSGITPEVIPTVSFSIAEDELRSMDAASMAGDYAAWNSFQSIASEENNDFVQSFKQRYGEDRVTDDPMEAAYFGVHLWAQTVQDGETFAPAEVRRNLANQSYPAPQGIVSIDPENQHTWKTVRIGRILDDGQFDIVWTSEYPVRPVPFPIYQSKTQWRAFLKGLYTEWGNQWANSANVSK